MVSSDCIIYVRKTSIWFFSTLTQYCLTPSIFAIKSWRTDSIAIGLKRIPFASSRQNFYVFYLLLCPVLDSWWWTQKLSEACRDLYQIKFEKLVHLVGFIITRMYHDARYSETSNKERNRRLLQTLDLTGLLTPDTFAISHWKTRTIIHADLPEDNKRKQN